MNEYYYRLIDDLNRTAKPKFNLFNKNSGKDIIYDIKRRLHKICYDKFYVAPKLKQNTKNSIERLTSLIEEETSNRIIDSINKDFKEAYEIKRNALIDEVTEIEKLTKSVRAQVDYKELLGYKTEEFVFSPITFNINRMKLILPNTEENLIKAIIININNINVDDKINKILNNKNDIITKSANKALSNEILYLINIIEDDLKELDVLFKETLIVFDELVNDNEKIVNEVEEDFNKYDFKYLKNVLDEHYKLEEEKGKTYPYLEQYEEMVYELLWAKYKGDKDAEEKLKSDIFLFSKKYKLNEVDLVVARKKAEARLYKEIKNMEDNKNYQKDISLLEKEKEANLKQDKLREKAISELENEGIFTKGFYLNNGNMTDAMTAETRENIINNKMKEIEEKEDVQNFSK